jgi:lysophospholipase L1-like esterase
MRMGEQLKASLTIDIYRYYISGIEVLVPRESSTFALIGDSITDGRCSTTDGDTRWPDFLFSRLQTQLPGAPSSVSSIAVVNQAAGGNCVLTDGTGGPSVLARLDRDVLSLSGVRFAMIFEGVNDIGMTPPDPKSQAAVEKRLIGGYIQVATRLKAAGVVVFIATITPFGVRNEADEDSDTETTEYSHPMREITRRRVNAWIRRHSPAVFDAVVEFDHVLRDPEESSVLAREYDSGDHLHPNEAAFQALANSFPLDAFAL